MFLLIKFCITNSFSDEVLFSKSFDPKCTLLEHRPIFKNIIAYGLRDMGRGAYGPSEVGGPASYRDALTSDIAGLRGAQERHNSCTVLRLTHSVWREERRLKH